jgi:hypothetical protein
LNKILYVLKLWNWLIGVLCQGYKNQLMQMDLSEGGEECNPGELTSVHVEQINVGCWKGGRGIGKLMHILRKCVCERERERGGEL